MNSQNSKKDIIIERLKTVYDPEFPMIDMYTLWLIYKVDIDESKKIVNVLMTFTTPFCPMADMIKDMIKNAVLEVVSDYTVDLEVTFEPAWNQSMIKDPDLQKMFM